MPIHIGSLISLLYRGAGHVHSLSAEYRDWSKPIASRNPKVERDLNGLGGLRLSTGPLFPRSIAASRRLWMESPNRLRVEIERPAGLVTCGVRDGSAWWTWSEEDGERSGRQDSLPQILDPIIAAPQLLLPALWLEVTGEGNRAGRDVVCARGVPRDPDADPTIFEFDFDCEYGTILRRADFMGGACTRLTEAVTLIHNPVIHPEAFRFKRRTPTSDNFDGARAGADPHAGGVASGIADNPWVSRPSPARSNVAKTIWLTSLSGIGETTVAAETERLLLQLGCSCSVLDGDVLRSELNSDLGHTCQHRREQARRTAEIAVLLARSGTVPIVTSMSAYSADRDVAREIHSRRGVDFFEVWLDASVEISSERIVKRVDCKAGPDTRLPQLPGIGSPYAPPTTPELVIDGHGLHPRLAAIHVVDAVMNLAPDSPKPQGIR